MKRCNLSIFGLGAVLMLTTMTTASAEGEARVPDTAAARLAADVIARAERAVATFVAACAARDAPGMNRVTTRDARIEYTLDDPGTFLSLDASALIDACATNRPGRSNVRPANYWVFPTNDANTVFVQYDAPAHTGEAGSHRQLALVEMRGDQILRMLNFAAMPSAVFAGTSRTATAGNDDRGAFDNYCRTCHSMNAGDHRFGPSLHGIFGAPPGSIAGYRDSAQGFSDLRLTWDETTLDRFIADPDSIVPNNNMKPYQGIRDPEVRREIIAFLKSSRDLRAATDPAKCR